MTKLLIVDDEPMVRRVLCHIIEERGIPVEVVGQAANGLEAVEMAMQKQPDLVMMDIKMPGLDGLAATEQILRQRKNTLVILLSAYDDFEYARKGLELGAYQYLLKPIAPDKIETMLEKAIGELADRKKLNNENRGEELERFKPYVKSSLLYHLISGTLKDEDIKEQEALLKVHILPGMAVVFGFDCDLDSDLENLIKNRIREELKTHQIEKDHVLMEAIGRRKLVMLISSKECSRGDKTKKRWFCDDLRLSVSQMVHATVTVGIGRPYQNFQEVRRSYLQARKAFKYGYILLGGNRVVYVDELDEEKRKDYPVFIKETVTNHILNGDWKHVNEDVRFTLKQIMQSTEDSMKKQVRIMELVILISRVAIDEGVAHKEILTLNAEFYQRMSFSDHLEDLAEMVLALIDAYRRLVAEANQSYGSKLIKRAQNYMKANFSSDITLKEVADVVNLSQHYFSRLFKSEVGVSFSEYLIRTRLNAAKKLMVDPALPISHISLQVGYNDASYFSRTFRKYEHVSPSLYREEVLQIKRESEDTTFHSR